MDIKQSFLPRWRGFNLLGMFCSEDSQFYSFRSPGYYSEEDFKMIADWGFDFVRLPLSYRIWSDVKNPYEINEEKISRLDEAVYYAEKYGLYINIAMHRLPGYCINHDEKIEEQNNLWTDKEALDAAAYQWTQIAKRYKNISSDRLSFNVINEPDNLISQVQYRTVNKRIINDVRQISPDRYFILDGNWFGDLPPVDAMRYFENCGYSCRGYEPRVITHHGLGDRTERPFWPSTRPKGCHDHLSIHDRSGLEQFFGIWAGLASTLNVGVHCGEMGVFHKCPHDVALRWLEDTLDVLKSYNIGFAIWNLRGKFGIMDNLRTDVELKEYNGHTLDEKMLKILQKY